MGLSKRAAAKMIRERARNVTHWVMNTKSDDAPHPGFSSIGWRVVEQVRVLDFESLVGELRQIDLMTGSEEFPWA